jgi:hypothetical protein
MKGIKCVSFVIKAIIRNRKEIFFQKKVMFCIFSKTLEINEFFKYVMKI